MRAIAAASSGRARRIVIVIVRARSAHVAVVQEDLVASTSLATQAQAAHVGAVEAGAVGQRRRVAADDDRAQRHVHLVDRIGGEELEQQVAAGFDQQTLDAARGERVEDPGDRQVAVARPGLDFGRESGRDGARRASRTAAGSPARRRNAGASGTSSERLTTTFHGLACSSGRSAGVGQRRRAASCETSRRRRAPRRPRREAGSFARGRARCRRR